MNILKWFLSGFFVVTVCTGIWYLGSSAIKIDREAAAQTPQPYTGPERREGTDRRSGEDRRKNDEVEQKEVAPYIFAQPRKDVTIWKMVHEGCEIYFSITLAYSNSTSIALGRGCK